MRYDHVFWDWNGTLFDDARSAWQAVNCMLDARKLPNISFEQYRDYIDVPIVRFYEKVMDVSAESMEALSVEFNTLWEAHLSSSPLADGAYEFLEDLSKKGIKQYIFSSSQSKMILPYLKRFGIEGFFEAVLGADDCYVGSKAERTRDYLIKNSISPQRAVFVGDMVHDSDVASLIGSECVLVSNGHQASSALVRTGRCVVDSFTALSAFLIINPQEVVK